MLSPFMIIDSNCVGASVGVGADADVMQLGVWWEKKVNYELQDASMLRSESFIYSYVWIKVCINI